MLLAVVLSCVILDPQADLLSRQLAFCQTPIAQSYPSYFLSTPEPYRSTHVKRRRLPRHAAPRHQDRCL